MAREFDVIIFGASGYTGRYVIEDLANSTKNKKLRWAVAGRNEEKVKASLELVQLYLEGIDIMNIPIIKADVSDEASISSMVKRAKLIYNCVGPYKFYGEVVVAACVQNGTHHVDISGEMKYLENTQAKYFKQAKEKNAYIVQACGFDSIPADYGIALLKQKFTGDLNSVETYVELFNGPEGRVTNIGTWMSAVHTVSDILHWSAFTKMLQKVFDKKMPKNQYPAKWRFPLFYSDIVHGWCLPFVGPDERVVMRTQMLNYHFHNERPIEMKPYTKVSSFTSALLHIFFVALFGFLSFFSIGRYLLGRFPSFFSGGQFSHEGPTRKQVEESSTKFTICGKGWAEKTAEPSDIHVEPPNKEMRLEITGPEPAYALTSMCMVQAGLVILDENDKMPMTGGVFTPGAAFAKTTLRQRLEARGMTFLFED